MLPFPVYQAGDSGKWLEGTLSLKVPIFGSLAGPSLLVSGWHGGSEDGFSLPGWELLM